MSEMRTACLDSHREDDRCQGPVWFHTMPGADTGFPRCDKHWNERLDRYEGSLEQEAQSPLPPSWFDPTYAGERWDEDDY